MTLDPIAYWFNFDHIHIYLIYYFTKKHCCLQTFREEMGMAVAGN